MFSDHVLSLTFTSISDLTYIEGWQLNKDDSRNEIKAFDDPWIESL